MKANSIEAFKHEGFWVTRRAGETSLFFTGIRDSTSFANIKAVLEKFNPNHEVTAIFNPFAKEKLEEAQKEFDEAEAEFQQFIENNQVIED